MQIDENKRLRDEQHTLHAVHIARISFTIFNCSLSLSVEGYSSVRNGHKDLFLIPYHFKSLWLSAMTSFASMELEYPIN